MAPRNNNPKNMARKPKTEPEDPNQQVNEPEVNDTAEAVAEEVQETAPEAKEENEAVEGAEPAKAAVVAGPAVSPAITKLLRTFNSYDELYITKNGGVFPKGHLPSRVKDAVLYKNPFFKNIN